MRSTSTCIHKLKVFLSAAALLLLPVAANAQFHDFDIAVEDIEVTIDWPDPDCELKQCEYEEYNFFDSGDPEDIEPLGGVPFCKPGTAPDAYRVRLNVSTSGVIRGIGKSQQCAACLSQFETEIERFTAELGAADDEDEYEVQYPGPACNYDLLDARRAGPCPVTSLELDHNFKYQGDVYLSVALPDAIGVGYYASSGLDVEIRSEIGLGMLNLYLSKTVPRAAQNYYFDCSEPLVLEVSGGSFGECAEPAGTVTLEPLTSGTLRSGEQCKALPESASKALDLLNQVISNLDSAIQELSSARRSLKIPAESKKNLTKAIRSLEKLLKGAKTRTELAEFYPTLKTKALKQGRKAVARGGKNYTPAVQRKLGSFLEKLKAARDGLYTLVNAPAAHLRSGGYCEIPRPKPDPIPQPEPPDTDGEDPGIPQLADQPFDYYFDSSHEFAAGSGLCKKDSFGEVIEIIPSACGCQSSDICRGREDCLAKARELGMESHPVVTTNSCDVAARDWCSLFARRTSRATAGALCGSSGSQIGGEFLQWDAAQLASAQVTPEGCEISYPRFPKATMAPACHRITYITYEEWDKMFNSVRRAVQGTVLFAIDGIALLGDATRYVLSASGDMIEPGGEPYYPYRLDPDETGLPLAQAKQLADLCKGHTEFWDALACIGQTVQEFYNTKNNRLQNVESECPAECMVCRHYAAAFVQACRHLTKQRGWEDKLSCEIQLNAVHAFPLITVTHRGKAYSYVYDVFNDPGCMDLIGYSENFHLIENPQP